jgi:SAM-dependent methyltransferase
MRLKADWETQKHATRTREFAIIFDRFPRPAFDAALELGAGDGFQSRLLVQYSRQLTVTDYAVPPSLATANGSVIALACDAERVGDAFPPRTFDLVFSSNVLEHLPDPQAALRGIHSVLTDDGITIHVMPNVIWKLCHVGLHLPNRVVLKLESRNLTREQLAQRDEHRPNNPKLDLRKTPSLRLVPQPHGVARTNLAEMLAFRRRRWAHEFKDAGFELVAVLKGPFSSGYRFGADRIRAILERCGASGEYVYVARKAGHASRFERLF